MKRVCGSLLLLLAPLVAQAGVDIQHWVAASGARVYFVETRALPIVDVQIDFSAGAAYEPPGKAGLAGLTRGLLDAGAGSLDEEHIAGRLVDLGAQLSGAADLDRAGLGLRTLSSKTERDAAIELLRTILQEPRFPVDVIEREKARTVAGIREAETRPDHIAAKRFSAALYPGHPYGASATAESVTMLTRDDVIGFYQGHFGARRATLSIVGDLSRAEAEAIAEALTGALPESSASAALPEVRPPVRQTLRIDHPATQAHIHVGLPAVRRGDPDYIPLLVGNYILGGGGFVSRLTKEVREKRGYAYSVYSYVQPLRQAGPFQIGLQTKRDQAGEALKLVDATVREFLATGPTREEVRAARRNLVDGFALRLDSNRKLLDHVAAIGFYGLPLTWLDDFPRQVEAATAASILSAFQRHILPAHMVTVIVAGD